MILGHALFYLSIPSWILLVPPEASLWYGLVSQFLPGYFLKKVTFSIDEELLALNSFLDTSIIPVPGEEVEQ